MNNFETTFNPTIIVSGGGAGAPKLAGDFAKAIPDARIILAQGTHDHGGASADIRDEYDTAAPGDLRNGIAAFATNTKADILNTRFGETATVDTVRELGDTLYQDVRETSPELDELWVASQLDATDEIARDLVTKGHVMHRQTYGNLLIGASARNTGDIGTAVKTVSTLLGLPDNRIVLPTSLVPHELILFDRDAHGNEIIIEGEGKIDTHVVLDPTYAHIDLTPHVPINPELEAEIEGADAFIIAAGSFLTSTAPALKAEGTPAALASMKPGAKVVAVANIADDGILPSMELDTYVEKVQEYTIAEDGEGREVDNVIFDDTAQNLPVGVKPIAYDARRLEQVGKIGVAIGGDIIDKTIVKIDPNGTCVRTNVHHDGKAVAGILRKLIISSAVDRVVDLPDTGAA